MVPDRNALVTPICKCKKFAKKGGWGQIQGKNLQNSQFWGWVGTLRRIRKKCGLHIVHFVHDPPPGCLGKMTVAIEKHY